MLEREQRWTELLRVFVLIFPGYVAHGTSHHYLQHQLYSAQPVRLSHTRIKRATRSLQEPQQLMNQPRHDVAIVNGCREPPRTIAVARCGNVDLASDVIR